MDETYFDEVPAANFETVTLEITKDLDGNEVNHPTATSDEIATARRNMENQGNILNQVPVSRDVSNIPFKHIDIRSFFTDRNEVVEKALKDCQETLINDEEKDIAGSWLLTEISLWDIEKERLVLLTKKAIYSIKYDFISLKILEYNRIPLSQIDTLVSGELIYPPSSLVPRLSGLAEGVSSSLTSCTGLAQFEFSRRSMYGVRLMWNKGDPLPLTKKWNPFAKDIPWLTYTSHPLFWYKGSEAEKANFDVEGLHSTVLSLLPVECNVKTASIIIENYFGLGALVHNKNELGFFKIRGKSRSKDPLVKTQMTVMDTGNNTSGGGSTFAIETTPRVERRVTRGSRQRVTKGLDSVTKFLSNFDPECSEREKRKLHRKLNQIHKRHVLYNELGHYIQSGQDLCDCLNMSCTGCHFPCSKCSSTKCGHDCRTNRKWTYESIENEGSDIVIRNSLLKEG